MIQIVIEIPERVYTYIQREWEECDFDSVINHVLNGIKNRTPLPKGHGRLKDIDAFITKVKSDREHSAYTRSWTADDVLNALNNSYAPTIIKADKAESEDEE